MTLSSAIHTTLKSLQLKLLQMIYLRMTLLSKFYVHFEELGINLIRKPIENVSRNAKRIKHDTLH